MWTPPFQLMHFLFDGELDFYLKNDLFLFIFFLEKRLVVATYFCFIFKRVDKIRKKTLSMTHYFWKRWYVKNRIWLGGQVTYREGKVKTVTPF